MDRRDDLLGDGLVEAAKIPQAPESFVNYFEIGQDVASADAAAAAQVDEDLMNKLRMTVNDLDLSVRASNCLESTRSTPSPSWSAARSRTSFKVRSFGKTSLREVKRKLTELNLKLGMELPEEFEA